MVTQQPAHHHINFNFIGLPVYYNERKKADDTAQEDECVAVLHHAELARAGSQQETSDRCMVHAARKSACV